MARNNPKKESKANIDNQDSVSLNKYISDSGFCSRREADDYIAQGRASINGEPANKGNRVYPGDVVEIDGEPIKKKVKTVYIAFNKPEGITCTTDTKDKTNIVSYINYKQRIFPIGRLDKDSNGLIFLTNDGDIVNKILRAGNRHEKEYIVTVDKPISTDFIRKMGEGVRIGMEKTLPAKIHQENKYVFRITLTQGLNRQIRRMCDALDYKVKKLTRVRIMNVSLGNLPLGHWRFLTEQEISIINDLVSQSSKTEEASKVKREKKKPVIEQDFEEETTEDEVEVTSKKAQFIPKKKKEAEQPEVFDINKPKKKKNLSYKEFRKKK